LKAPVPGTAAVSSGRPLGRPKVEKRLRPGRERRTKSALRGGLAVGLLTLVVVGRAFAANTGFLNPAAQSADTGGDNNGFEVGPGNAFFNNLSFARNMNGTGDRHRYFNYGISVPAGSFINGIEVRLDWWLDSTSGTNSMSVELSWNGGANWTAAKTNTAESTSDTNSKVLGSATDDWGHNWTTSELSNDNFRVRVRSNSSSSSRDFYLDWVPVKVHYTPVEPNPALAQSCGVDMVLVMDSSGSISSTELGQMKTAFKAFVGAFLPSTPTQIALVEFDNSATVRHVFTGDAGDDDGPGDTDLYARIDQAASGGRTNWDDALFDARNLFPNRPDHPDLIVFASDGNPNNRGGHTALGHSAGVVSAAESAAMEWAIQEANTAKLAGVRIVTLGIGGGSGESEALDVPNLVAISGPTVSPPAAIDAATDVILTDFSTLAGKLKDLALELCGGTITVHKTIDGDGDIDTLADQSDGSGWTFTANASPDSSTPAFGATDGDGMINFAINLGADSTATVDMLETMQPGFVFISGSCTKPDGPDDGTDPDPVGSPGTNAVNDIVTGPQDIITCNFYNRGTVDLYILDIDDDLAGDELIFNLVSENLLPGETETWTLRLRNDGTLPWDLDPAADIDMSLSSGWSCEGTADPEFSVSLSPVLPFPDGVDDHGGLIHVEPGDTQDIDAEVSLVLGAGNDCQGDTFSLIAVFTATQHTP